MANPSNEIGNKVNSAATDFKNKYMDGETSMEKFNTMAAGLAKSSADSLQDSRDYVKANPAKGVALAASAGIIVGSLLTMALRGRRDK